jgi:hypothetical protein
MPFQKGNKANKTGKGGFRKGVSGNPGGRPRELVGVRELARQQGPKAIETLTAIMDDEKAPPNARTAAANALLDRGFGRPEQHSTDDVKHVRAELVTDDELAGIISRGSGTAAPAASDDPSKLH